MKYFYSRYLADYTGIASSGLCIIHCLLMPLVFSAQSVYLQHQDGVPFHLDYLFLFLSFVAVYYVTRQNSSHWINTLLWLSFGLFAVSVIFQDVFYILIYFQYLASFLLILGHILHIRRCNQCNRP